MLNHKELLHPLLNEFIATQVDVCGEIYLVGGASRDLHLRKEVQDVDFAVKKGAITAAKNTADFFNGDFYILDKERGTARTLIVISGKELRIDFALFNGKTINDDLKKRDFTINAMAIKIPSDGKVIDPLDGRGDLTNSILRSCSPTSYIDDPVRVIRAVRFMHALDLRMDRSEIELIKDASRRLDEISNERKRDEIIHLLEQTNVKKSLMQMLELGIIEQVFPEVMKLHKIDLDTPHVHNAWMHTLQVVNFCQQLMVLPKIQQNNTGLHPRVRQAIKNLKNHKKNIFDYMNDQLNINRSMYSLLILTCIYHDTGKGVVNSVIKGNRQSFPKHAKAGSELIRRRAKAMGFSNSEVDCLSKAVRYHMKPSRVEFNDDNEKDIHIHRFFKKAGSAGILVGFIHMADVLATYEDTLTEDRWNRAISSVDNIFDAFFNYHDTIIKPRKIISGNDVLREFHLKPGKKVGDLLDQVVEAQVIGAVDSKTEAIGYLEKLISVEEHNQDD